MDENLTFAEYCRLCDRRVESQVTLKYARENHEKNSDAVDSFEEEYEKNHGKDKLKSLRRARWEKVCSRLDEA